MDFIDLQQQYERLKPRIHERINQVLAHDKFIAGSHKYDNVCIGINGRLDTVQAAILLSKLEIFESEIKMRQDIVSRYPYSLNGLVQVPFVPGGFASAWEQYSVVTGHREIYLNALKGREIPAAIYWP